MPRRVALIAGSGSLVPAVVAAIKAGGDAYRIIAVVPRIDLDDSGIALGAFRATGLIAAIRDYAPTHIAMAGGIHLSDGDRRDLAAALQMGVETPMGDMALGLAGERLAKLTGAALLDLDALVPDLIAPEGPIAGPPVAPEIDAVAAYAFAQARAAGALDLCQAVVASGRRLVAAEDIGGTDLLLDRVAAFRDIGLVSTGMVLAKASKPGQPAFFDLPAIGPVTIRKASDAGIVAIVVEAHRTLLLDRHGIESAANELGIAVFGLRANG